MVSAPDQACEVPNDVLLKRSTGQILRHQIPMQFLEFSPTFRGEYINCRIAAVFEGRGFWLDSMHGVLHRRLGRDTNTEQGNQTGAGDVNPDDHVVAR